MVGDFEKGMKILNLDDANANEKLWRYILKRQHEDPYYIPYFSVDMRKIIRKPKLMLEL